MSVAGWLEEAGVVLARGLLAGTLTGAGTGLAAGTVFGGFVGGVVGLVIGGIIGVCLAMVAAPVLAVLHAEIGSGPAARLAGASSAAVAVTGWAVVLDADLTTGLAWTCVGAGVGLLVGRWVVLGNRERSRGAQGSAQGSAQVGAQAPVQR